MNELKKARENVLVMMFMAIVCSLLYLWVIPTFVPVPRAAEGESFTPQTLPYLLTTVMTICTVWGLISYGREYLKIKKETENQKQPDQTKEKSRFEKINEWIPYVVFLTVVGYGILINACGFILSTIVLIPVVLLIIGCKKWNYYVIAYLFAALVWVVFRFVLKIQLP